MAEGSNNDIRKEIIVGINLDTGEAAGGVQELKDKLNSINGVDISKSTKSLRQDLKDAQDAAQRIAKEFGTTSIQFKNAATKVADLKNEIDEVNLSINNFNPDNKLAALGSMARASVGALQGVSGAMAFLGVESESAAKTIMKLQGLMAMSEALNSLGDIKDSWKNITSMLGLAQKQTQATTAAIEGQTVATKTATVATRTFGLALKALGIGLIVSAIAYLITNFDSLKRNLFEMFPALEKSGEHFDRLKNIAMGVGNAILQFIVAPIKVMISAIQGDFSAALDELKKGAAIIDNFNQGVTSSRLRQEQDKLNAIIQKNIEAKEKELDILKAKGQESYDLEKKIIDQKMSLLKKDTDEYKNLQHEKEVLEAQHQKKMQDERDKALAERRQKQRDADEVEKRERERIHNERITRVKDIESKINLIREDAIAALKKRNMSELDLMEEDYKAKRKIVIDEELALQKLEKELYGEAEAKIRESQRNSPYGITFTTLFALDTKYENDVDDYIMKAAQDIDEFNQMMLNKDDEYYQQKLDIDKFFLEKEQALIKANKDGVFDERIKQLKEMSNALKAVIDEEKRLNTLAIQADSNLIQTEIDNEEDPMDRVNQAKAKVDAITNAKIDAEIKAFEAEKLRLGNNQTLIENLEKQHAKRLVDIKKEGADKKKEIDQKSLEHQLAMADVSADLIDKASQLAGESTVEGKAMAVAATTISTYSSAQKAYATQLIPGDPSSVARGWIAAAAAVAAGLLRVKQILAVKVPGNTGSGSVAPSISTAPVINASATTGVPSSIQDVRVVNDQDKVVRAYITDRDLKDAEQKSDFLEKLSTI